MARFAYHYFAASPDVYITHVIGNQSYDGKVEDGRAPKGAVRFIEVTDSTRDHTEALRMELLSRDGHAPGSGPIEVVGQKGHRTLLRGRYEMRDRSALPQQHLDRVRDVIVAKAEKKYAEGTALVVHIDDSLQFREPAHVAALEHLAISQLVPLLSRREFRVLALVGADHVNVTHDLS